MRLTRAELYEKVWATPMRTLGQEFGISDVGLAKVCRKHNIPVPPVGYWRRKETGYKVTQPPLPAEDGREHLDIYIRERLRPEFEELARQVAPKIAIAPTSPIHSFYGLRSFSIGANSTSAAWSFPRTAHWRTYLSRENNCRARSKS
jgi:hypothetical protein